MNDPSIHRDAVRSPAVPAPRPAGLMPGERPPAEYVPPTPEPELEAELEQTLEPPDRVPEPSVAELPADIRGALEAVLMVADEPLPVIVLAAALDLPTAEVDYLLTELAADYRGDLGGRRRGFELREAGGGWRIYSAPAFADVVTRFVQGGQTARLTQAALETLAVIAYRQPVSRGQISAVRGVSVDGVVRTLSVRGLIAEVDTDPTTGAILYGTTGYFLERMGMSSLDELPALAPFLPELDAIDALVGAAGGHAATRVEDHTGAGSAPVDDEGGNP